MRDFRVRVPGQVCLRPVSFRLARNALSAFPWRISLSPHAAARRQNRRRPLAARATGVGSRRSQRQAGEQRQEVSMLISVLLFQGSFPARLSVIRVFRPRDLLVVLQIFNVLGVSWGPSPSQKASRGLEVGAREAVR